MKRTLAVSALIACLAVPGLAHAAGVLNGISQWVTAPATGQYNALNSQSQATVAAWVKVGALVGSSQRHNVFTASTTASPQGDRLYVAVTGDGRVQAFARAKDSDNNLRGGISAAGLIPQGTWTHVAASFTLGTNKTGVIRLYVNGALQATFSGLSFSAASFPATGSYQARLGSGGDSGGFFTLHGSLEDVRVYSRALTDSEVDSVYMNPDTSVTDMVSCWPFNDLASYWWPLNPVHDVAGTNAGKPDSNLPNEAGPVTPPSP